MPLESSLINLHAGYYAPSVPLVDNVNKPTHYNLNEHGIECIQAIQASMSKEAFEGYLKGNTIKYLWRYKYKTKPLEDLEKAEYYLKRLIKETKGTKNEA